jgi:hypothetical protein
LRSHRCHRLAAANDHATTNPYEHRQKQCAQELGLGERGLTLLVVNAPAQQLILAGALLRHGSAYAEKCQSRRDACITTQCAKALPLASTLQSVCSVWQGLAPQPQQPPHPQQQQQQPQPEQPQPHQQGPTCLQGTAGDLLAALAHQPRPERPPQQERFVKVRGCGAFVLSLVRAGVLRALAGIPCLRAT